MLRSTSFPSGSMVKNLPTIKEMRVQPLGGKDPLGKEMATPSSLLAWEIPWTEERGGLQSMGSQRVGHLATKQQAQEDTVIGLSPSRHNRPNLRSTDEDELQ